MSALAAAGTYAIAETESRELHGLGICLKNIKGIGKDVQLANASFIWTEPHSKELKVKLELQQEAIVGVVVRQTVVVELRVNNLQCDDCKKSYTKHTWDSSVQVRQRSEHRRTLMMLEQLILKHKAHTKLIQLTPCKEGLDFFFNKERDAQDFVSFLKNWAVVRHHESKHLVSHNAQNTTYRFKRTTCVEVCPICRDDLVFLPRKIAQALGGLPPLMLCTKASSHLSFVDPASSRVVEVAAAEYWRKPFQSVSIPSKLTEFIVLDIEEFGHPSGRGGVGSICPCEVEIARVADFGHNDERITVRCHLGALLHVGDYVLGYDLRSLHLGMDDEEMGGVPPLEVYLVKKKRPERIKKKPPNPKRGKGSAASVRGKSPEPEKQDTVQLQAPSEDAVEEDREELEDEAAEMKAAAEALLTQLGEPNLPRSTDESEPSEEVHSKSGPDSGCPAECPPAAGPPEMPEKAKTAGYGPRRGV
ncbi:NMD3 [Symbiodinium pilosum]|uniref:60S ribosomal export protein NMD3 n=1 Tax=Symbiodinium pilosum TaxID=2952 RepID=A0A812WJ38_SYMPI|nr:NMD3 [Symbiodinium pilosum]